MRFRKKPVVIEAIQWTGDNAQEVREFMREASYGWNPGSHAWVIVTLEGNMSALPGDWIIKGVKGEFYPCKPDIFAATYEPVE